MKPSEYGKKRLVHLGYWDGLTRLARYGIVKPYICSTLLR